MDSCEIFFVPEFHSSYGTGSWNTTCPTLVTETWTLFGTEFHCSGSAIVITIGFLDITEGHILQRARLGASLGGFFGHCQAGREKKSGHKEQCDHFYKNVFLNSIFSLAKRNLLLLFLLLFFFCKVKSLFSKGKLSGTSTSYTETKFCSIKLFLPHVPQDLFVFVPLFGKFTSIKLPFSIFIFLSI